MLAGKTALVTGASRGIGRAITLSLAKEGADIALVYAGNVSAAEEVLEQARTLGVKAEAFRCDVADHAAVKELIAAVLAQFGSIDILVNNAGITRDGLLLTMKEADYDAVLDTNLKGAYNTIKHIVPHMIKKRSGRIINISSVAGLMGNAGQVNYAAAKAGLVGLTKSAAKELAARNITCNAVAPGFIETDMTGALSERVRQALLEAIPLKRMGKAEDVAALVAFLAGPAAAYITGEVVRVDGGLAM